MEYSTDYGKRPIWQWIIIYLIIGGLIYGVIYYFYVGKKSSYPSPTAVDTTTQTLPQNTVTITTTGFQPSNITIKTGDTVTWTNSSESLANVSSAPHPAHTDYSPLNLGNIAPKRSTSLTFPTAGTYKYHNHLNSSQFGSVTVQ